MGIDRASAVFGNKMSERDFANAVKTRNRFNRRFGDGGRPQHLEVQPLPVIGPAFGARNLGPARKGAPAFSFPAESKPLVVGNIRMGFGHYRISMAIASAAHALGYDPFWLDLMGFPESACSKIISHQNNLYSLGSRMSQQVGAFNKLVWEPMNSEGFRKLSYNASDQKVAELMVPVFADLPRDVPFVAAHAWPAQAAVHAGLSRVVNAVPDNWPMALHLAQGALHTVQTPSSYWGYRNLRGMDKSRVLKPMPTEALRYVGHYVDHELTCGIEEDCAARRARASANEPVRFLLSVGGAGAQFDLFAGIIEHLLPSIEAGRATLWVNVGDHDDVWNDLVRKLPMLESAETYFDDYTRTQAFAEVARTETVYGVHAFCHQDIFAAVYSTNLLMRVCDVLVTKPGELSFYPVPKLMIRRVGGHEAWGAIRAAEVGDGTYEMDSLAETCATLDLMQADRSLVPFTCDHIETARQAGIYDGAYRVVKLAVGDME